MTSKLDLSKPACRVCLQNDNDYEMSSIFDLDTELDDLFIYEKIEQCTGIEVLRDGKLPTFICDACSDLLKVSYEFRITCRNSDEFLKEILAAGPTVAQINKLEQNPLSISENTNNKNSTRSKLKKDIDDELIPIPEFIKNEITVNPDSPSHFEEPIEDNFNDYDTNVMCFDIDYRNHEDDDHLSDHEDVKVSIEKINFDIEEEKPKPKRNKKAVKGKRKSNVKNKKSRNDSSEDLPYLPEEDEIKRAKKPRVKKEKKEKRPHICEICGNKFQHRYSLKNHIKRHLNEKSFKCEICGYSCHSNIELVRHLRKHTGSKPFKCSYCPRSFGDRSTIVKHERVHRNERPFKCDICGKSFCYTGVLNCHKLIHTGEKPYRCEICNKCFNTRHHLRSHLKTIQHKNDPRVEALLQNIRKNNDEETSK